MPASPTASPEHIKYVNTRYHDAAADGIRRQVGNRLRRHRPAPGAAEALEGSRRARRRAVRRRARDRLRDRLLLAQPAPARDRRAPDRDRHLAGDARPPRRDRRDARSRGGDGRHRGRGASLRRRELRHRLRPRRPPPHPRCRARLRRVQAGAATGWGDRLRRRAVPLRRQARRGAEARGNAGGAGLARPGRRQAARGPGVRDLARPLARGRGRRPCLRAGGPAATAARFGLRAAPGLRRGAARQRLGLGTAHPRVHRRARIASPGAGGNSPSTATSPCRASTPRLLEPRLPAELFYNLLASGRRPA